MNNIIDIQGAKSTDELKRTFRSLKKDYYQHKKQKVLEMDQFEQKLFNMKELLKQVKPIHHQHQQLQQLQLEFHSNLRYPKENKNDSKLPIILILFVILILLTTWLIWLSDAQISISHNYAEIIKTESIIHRTDELHPFTFQAQFQYLVGINYAKPKNVNNKLNNVIKIAVYEGTNLDQDPIYSQNFKIKDSQQFEFTDPLKLEINQIYTITALASNHLKTEVVLYKPKGHFSYISSKQKLFTDKERGVFISFIFK